MATQYSNFSNPTITSDQPMGWQAAQQQTGNAINSIGSYLANQQSKVQQLQIEQAGDLSKAHIMASQYYPQAVPVVENMMKNNPYAMRAFGNQQGGSLGQAGQMGGNPNMFASMIGAPGANAYGGGMYPTTANGTADSTQGGGINMSPVATSMTMGGGKPPEQTVINPVGEQVKSAATSSGSELGKASVPGAVGTASAAGSYGSKMGEEQATANTGSVRDDAQFNQMAQSLKNILDLHGKLSDKGLAGSGPNEAFTEGVYNNIPNLPFMGGMNPQKNLTNPESQDQLGRFTSSRNENMIRFQPQLSQQYGQAGSIRIMDSLLNLAGGEIPSLATPHDQAVGNVQGTLRSLYVFKESTNAYAQHLQAIGAKMPQNPQDYINGVAPYISQFKTALTPEDEKELGTLTNQVTGKNQLPAQGGSVNPVMNQQGKQQAQPSKTNIPTNRPAGATHYSPSTGKFYNDQGNVVG